MRRKYKGSEPMAIGFLLFVFLGLAGMIVYWLLRGGP